MEASIFEILVRHDIVDLHVIWEKGDMGWMAEPFSRHVEFDEELT